MVAKVAEFASERVSRFVFVDALALRHGERIRDIVTRPAPIETDVAIGRSPEDSLRALQGSLLPEMAGWAAERFGMHPTDAFSQPVVMESFWDMR